MEPRDVFIGLGSNIDPERNVVRMLDVLCELSDRVDVSPIVRTVPVDIDGGGQQFLNLAVRITTALPLPDLKERLNGIEATLGRDRSHPRRQHRERTADLDILFAVPSGATRLPAGTALPHEAYLRPQLDALLAHVGLLAPGEQRDPEPSGDTAPPTVTLVVQGTEVGRACATLGRSGTEAAKRPA